MSLLQGHPATPGPNRLLGSFPAVILASFTLAGCSNTSKDLEIDPSEPLDPETRLLNHFNQWKRGENGLPDSSLRSEFERTGDVDRTEWKTKSYSREEYPDHPYFRAGTVERPAWKGHDPARESGSANTKWQNRRSGVAGQKFKTRSARESGSETPRSAASLPQREFESGPSIEDGRRVPLKILKDAGSDKTLSRKEAAKRILSLPDRESAMTVEEVRRLLSPDR